MFPDDIQALAATVIDRARRAGLRLATAESCTGGLVAGALTAVAGSSAAFERGYVTYGNAAKIGLLDVPADLIVRDGAVSEEVARQMAAGAIRDGADVVVAVTGIAGPGGGSAEKPVGLVWFAAVGPVGAVTEQRRFPDRGREAVRLDAVRRALELLADRLP